MFPAGSNTASREVCLISSALDLPMKLVSFVRVSSLPIFNYFPKLGYFIWSGALQCVPLEWSEWLGRAAREPRMQRGTTDRSSLGSSRA